MKISKYTPIERRVCLWGDKRNIFKLNWKASFFIDLKKIMIMSNVYMQIGWVGIPTAPAWLPTDMLIKVQFLFFISIIITVKLNLYLFNGNRK